MNRRLLLGWMASLSALALVPGSRHRANPKIAWANRLVRVIQYPRSSAIAIGTAYLISAPHEASVETLAHKLASTMTGDFNHAVRQRISGAELRNQYEAQVRADFDTANTRNVSGWVLAKTECRLLAYIALSDQAARTV